MKPNFTPFAWPMQWAERILQARRQYPGQFWLLFWGMLISTAGASMIWPFLMIYVSEKLDLPLTSIASLMTLNAAAGLIASFVAGPIADRIGRRWVMVIGLAATGISYIAMIPAETLMHFAILMTLRGLFNPLYRIGSDAMVADLIPDETRADAYALTRLSKNVGISMGPAVGGLVASASYAIAFWVAAIGLVFFSLLMLFFAHETLPKGEEKVIEEIKPRRLGGYAEILADRRFIVFALAFTLTQIGATIIWVLLGVYAKTNYGVLESQYGFIPMTNALMVVGLQVWVTKRSKNRPPLAMLAVGAGLYALGVGSVAFGDGFWGFWASMVVLTLGELILVPTATTYVAALAPAQMRGRYMSIFALTWGIASGVGPVVGGYLNDAVSPQAIWIGGGLIGMLGALWYLLQHRHYQQHTAAVQG
ncbi:MAG: MFS transporter [Anaerolineales bacterium]|nr:MFS transporter [Anaerolineales bacterium]